MQAEIKDLKDTFKVGYEAFESSRKEANEVWDFYHNRQYNPDQLAMLESRGQPAETFNVVKKFARMLVGYYSTIVNTVRVVPNNYRDVDKASLLNDVVNSVFVNNRMDIEGDRMKLGGLISGIMCSYINVVDSGERDQFGRPVYSCEVHSVPDYEIVLDPNSYKDDYSDARFLHRFKWMSEEEVNSTFGVSISEKLQPYYNFLNEDEADFEFNYGEQFTGYFRVFNNYLVVHSVIEDDQGKRWSCYWSDDEMLLKEEITYKEARWPYRVQRLHSSNRSEYYGIFREVTETQKSINQALLKIQLMVNSQRAFVEEGAVENLAEFTNQFNRVNAVIPVLSLQKVKLENMASEVQQQYVIIDKALERIQNILSINDSFLGLAYASDSGRKVKLQQNATIMALRYITARIESFYQSMGQDVASLIKQYYYANQILAVADETVGTRWVEINKPLLEPTGKQGPDGSPLMQPILIEALDPATLKPMEDEQGNIILAPIPEEDSEFAFTRFEIDIESNAYNDEDEKAQLMLETVLSGPTGQMLMQANPAGYLKAAALNIKSMKTKYSPNIVEIFEQTAQALQGGGQEEAAAVAGNPANQGPRGSAQLKLPQNTNEGA